MLSRRLEEQEKAPSFKHVKLVCLAEYVGIEQKHPKSQHSLLWWSTLRHLDFQPQNAFLPDGNAQSIHQECERFERVLRENPMDLCIGGLAWLWISVSMYVEY